MIETVNRTAAAVLLAGLVFLGGAHFQAHRWPTDIQPAQTRTFAPFCVDDEVRMEGVRARCQHLGEPGDQAWRWL